MREMVKVTDLNRLVEDNPQLCLEIVLTRDGNSFCALSGPDIQAGVVGFAYTPAGAVLEFALALLRAIGFGPHDSVIAADPGAMKGRKRRGDSAEKRP